MDSLRPGQVECVENLAGLLVLVTIAVATGGIAWEAIGRLAEPRRL